MCCKVFKVTTPLILKSINVFIFTHTVHDYFMTISLEIIVTKYCN